MSKVEKIRGRFGVLNGYKLGGYYLMKKYYLGNHYCWIINRSGKDCYWSSEEDKHYIGIFPWVSNDPSLIRERYEFKKGLKDDPNNYILVHCYRHGLETLKWLDTQDLLGF